MNILWKKNKDFFEENKRKGKLHSILKDGPGKTGGLNWFVNYGYQVVLLGASLFAAAAAVGLKKRWRWRVYVPFVVMLSILGWSWNIYILKQDPSFPSWILRPMAQLGPDFLQTIEDWIFYPVMATMFYTVYRLLQYRIREFQRRRSVWLWSSVAVFVALMVFYGCFTATCGRSLALWFGVPSLVVWLLVRRAMNVRMFVYFMAFAVAFESAWDFLAASLIHRIPGMAWAVQWSYVTFDQAGRASHSQVFLSYEQYPWAWIFENPIEMTPWIGILSILPFVVLVGLDRAFGYGDLQEAGGGGAG
jgi:hypothetical protein